MGCRERRGRGGLSVLGREEKVLSDEDGSECSQAGLSVRAVGRGCSVGRRRRGRIRARARRGIERSSVVSLAEGETRPEGRCVDWVTRASDRVSKSSYILARCLPLVSPQSTYRMHRERWGFLLPCRLVHHRVRSRSRSQRGRPLPLRPAFGGQPPAARAIALTES